MSRPDDMPDVSLKWGCLLYGAAAVIVLVVLLASCAPRYAKWPYQGPLLCLVNASPDTVTVYARDGIGRMLELARHMKPGDRRTARWPFVHTAGLLLAGPHGRPSFWSPAFQPWDADTWRWTLGGNLEPGRCP